MSTEKDASCTQGDGNLAQLRRTPLVGYCTNEWQIKPRSASPPSVSSDSDAEPLEELHERVDRWVDTILAVIKAPKFRRLMLSITLFILCSVLLWVKIIGPWIAKERAGWSSLSRQAGDNAGESYGTNARPKFPGVIQVAELDAKLLPNAFESKRRLIFIGDIHGCKKELLALLEKVKFDPESDTIITVGDIISKGPHSLGVIDLLRERKAFCVRGNHEDRVLLYANQAKGTSLKPEKNFGGVKSKTEHQIEKQLAGELSHDQISYLRSFPLALRVGNIKGMGDVVVVHAGLVPGVPIDNQDPLSIMNMRIIDLKTHVPSKKHQGKNSIPWFKLWNKFQRLLPGLSSTPQTTTPGVDGILSRRTTVIYGHDSRRGLQMGKFTKGLDSGCVKGQKLTALVVSHGGRQEIIQVDCPRDYTVEVDLDEALQGRSASTNEGD